MKLLVISDVHGNIDGLRAVEKDAGSVDRVLFLGDMVDYGFYPHEVIRWMQEHQAIAVAGNHDRYLVNLADSGTVPLANPMEATTFAEYTLASLTPEDMDYLRALPQERVEELDGITYYMAHTYSDDDVQAFLKLMVRCKSVEAFESVWAEKVGAATLGQPRRIIYGHSHQCMAHMVRRGAMWLNPGSLSYRIGSDSRACGGDYILIRDGEVLLRHVDYPTEHLYQFADRTSLQEFDKKCAHSAYKQEVL